MTTYVLGGGCFWCVEAAYAQVRGVVSLTSGYTGGHLPDPSYEMVCTGATGHAEVVRVEFDESVIPADTVLDMFFTMHDPTTPDRQGNDVGTQYRSAMFFADEGQRTVFEAAVARAQGWWEDPVVTEIVPLGDFYPAEEYHQDYYAKNPNQGYCRAVVGVKVGKVRSAFAEWLR